jgi:hypothetical protein
VAWLLVTHIQQNACIFHWRWIPPTLKTNRREVHVHRSSFAKVWCSSHPGGATGEQSWRLAI